MKYLAILAALVMAGCSSGKSMPLDDGYQFGDGTRTLLKLQHEFCTNDDPVAEVLLWSALNKARPLTGGVNLCDINVLDYIRGE